MPGSGPTQRDPRAPAEGGRVVLVSAVALLAMSVMTLGFARPIDDFWLALASGRALLSGQADAFQALPFTFTPSVEDALNPQWGAQVVFAALGGPGPALALHALLVSVGLAVTAMRVRRRASASVTVVTLLLVLGVLSPHLDARPQSFSVLLLPVCFWLLETHGRRPWLPVAYFLVIAIWANLHGAFVVGQLAALGSAAWAVTRGRSRATVPLIVTAVAASVAPLVNPVGIRLLRYAYGLGDNPVIQRLSTEWQPSWVLTPISLIFWGFLALALGLRWRGRARVSGVELLWSGSLLVLAVLMVRAIPWAVLAAAPVLAADIDALRARHAALSDALTSPGVERAGRLAKVAIAALGVLIVFQLARPALADPRLYDGMPVALVDRMHAELPQGVEHRVINSQRWGGYLKWRLGERVLTFVDGRLEVPKAGTWDWYLRLTAGHAAAVQEAEARGARWALVSAAEDALVATLRERGWTVVAEDRMGTLLRR